MSCHVNGNFQTSALVTSPFSWPAAQQRSCSTAVHTATLRAVSPHTNLNGNTRLDRYTVDANDPNVIDINSRVNLLKVNQPYINHNGGMLAFGADGARLPLAAAPAAEMAHV